MRVARLGLSLGAAVISCHLFAGAAHAQDGGRRAPAIRVTTELGNSVVSNYIEPSISLSEDAYVFVISVDVDRRIQVLHPDVPGISVKMASRQQLHLPRFFAVFGEGDRLSGGTGMGYASYDGYSPGFSDTRGTIIALASRKPFNLSAITGIRDWDLDALRHLIEGRDPQSAAAALARYIGAGGEPIGRDIYRFAGASRSYNTAYLYNTAYYQCGSYYGSLGYARGFSPGYAISYFRAAQLQQAGYLVNFLGIDACGQPHFVVYPHAVAGAPVGRQPATGAFPQSRLPVAVPRNPTRGESLPGRITGARPGAEGRYSERDVTTAPPAGRITEPRSVPERFRPQPASGSLPERARVPAEASRTPRPPERVSAPVYVPERMSAPRPAPVVERERPAPAPDPKPVDG